MVPTIGWGHLLSTYCSSDEDTAQCLYRVDVSSVVCITPDHQTICLFTVYSTSSASVTPPSVGLVRKLVSVLETTEKLPIYSYDQPGHMLNIQVGCGSGGLQSCACDSLRSMM